MTFSHLLDHKDRGNRTSSRIDPHILEETARNNKEHPIENRVFWMTLAVNPCRGKEDGSRNGPVCSKRPCSLDVPGIHTPSNFMKSANKG